MVVLQAELPLILIQKRSTSTVPIVSSKNKFGLLVNERKFSCRRFSQAGQTQRKKDFLVRKKDHSKPS